MSTSRLPRARLATRSSGRRCRATSPKNPTPRSAASSESPSARHKERGRFVATNTPPGIDPEAVGRIINQTGLHAEMLSRGRSNLTYRVWNDHGEWVVRRPPLGHVLETAHDMGRE